MQLTNEDIDNLPFQSFKKTALLQARPLAQEDYQQRGGIIETREGPARFKPGDYLARGIESEQWPITKAHFEADYERVSDPDTEGFASYRTNTICQAYQMPKPFTVRRKSGDLLKGKAGDYLLRSGDRIWIVDQTIFENSYKPLAES